MGSQRLVNPLRMLARRLEEGGKIPPEIKAHIDEVIRRVLLGSQTGFEFDTYAALAHKLLSYVEWCKAMSVLCAIDWKDAKYEDASKEAIRWRNSYLTCHVPAPAMARLGVLRPSHKGGGGRAAQTLRARHKNDPNAPIAQSPNATIGRHEPSQDLPPEPTGKTSWMPPALNEPEEEEQ